MTLEQEDLPMVAFEITTCEPFNFRLETPLEWPEFVLRQEEVIPVVDQWIFDTRCSLDPTCPALDLRCEAYVVTWLTLKASN